MGTRGFIGVAINGEAKITYNHFDSYPEHLGVLVLRTVGRWFSGSEVEHRADQALKLTAVDPESKPSPEDVERLSQYRAKGIGEPGSWYELLRETQGSLDDFLDAGVYEDASQFALDSLFCEWGYLVDFDRRRLEVYEGFQQQPPTAGRWVGVPPSDDVNRQADKIGHLYYPVNKIIDFPLGNLPFEGEFLRLVRAPSRVAEDGDDF